MCGGTVSQQRRQQFPAGLSPRVRGNLGRGAWSGATWRSIPACAGEPASRACTFSKSRVYPRVCGGTDKPGHAAFGDEGLSPRVRGNHRPVSPFSLLPWSIPACAGEPPVHRRLADNGKVYPRVCGGTPWPFDSDPCYHIRQRNNAAPSAIFYQITPAPSIAGGRLSDGCLHAGRSAGLFGG